MYRPTVRYDDSFRIYVDELFHATNLDRNQIMRLALFLLGHTKEGKNILNHFKKDKTTSLPSPGWMENAHGLWYGKTIEIEVEGGTSDKDVTKTGIKIIDDRGEGRHVKGKGMDGSERPIPRQGGEVCHSTNNTGTIRFIIK